jgi:hypothetical protein
LSTFVLSWWERVTIPRIRSSDTKESRVPSRRDRKKADATPTPLAALATDIPERDTDFDAAELSVATPEPDDDMLPESTATMPVVGPETDTAPANVRTRPGARKISARAEIEAVPRTIAEMQAQDEVGTVYVTDEPEEEIAPPEPLFVGPRTLLLGTLIPFAIVTLTYVLVDAICRAIGIPNIARNVINFATIGASAIIALMLGVRNWQAAFHDLPTDLHPRSLLDLWQRRGTGPQRDMWVSAGLWIVAGFAFMLLFTLVFAPFSYGLNAAYFIPYLLFVLFAKLVGAFFFLGYLERGLLALATPTRAALVTGALYSLALIVVNVITIAVSDPSAVGVMLTYAVVSIIVAFAAAWIRVRSGSLLAAIAFQLLLLLLGFQV